MEIVLALVYGAALGLGAHFLIAGRHLRGIVVAPVLGALVSGLVWMIMTWAGVTIESPWIWVASILAPIIIVLPTLAVLARTRAAHDDSERARLGIA
jgi:hypothetical protein